MEVVTVTKITVLGAGNGGQALAGDLASQNFEVTLFEHPQLEDKITDLKKEKTITLTGIMDKKGHLAKVTTCAEEAIRGAQIIYFLAPSFAQKPILESIAPYIEDNQKLVLMPGNFGSLVFKNYLKKIGNIATIEMAEADTMPYACRLEAAGRVNIWGIKQHLSLAALPGHYTETFISQIQHAFPIRLKAAPNVIAIGLYNTNMILHCPTMIMNAGRIESENGNFRFYGDGMTEAVCSVMEAMDKERILIGNVLGIKLLSTMDDMKKLYNLEGKTLRETILNNVVYCGHGTDAPTSMTYRYLSEDVPYLLVPVASLAQKLGISTPTINSIIHLASIVNGQNYFETGIGLKELGLEKASVEEIRAL
jgi:opine dehydrogenase